MFIKLVTQESIHFIADFFSEEQWVLVVLLENRGYNVKCKKCKELKESVSLLQIRFEDSIVDRPVSHTAVLIL